MQLTLESDKPLQSRPLLPLLQRLLHTFMYMPSLPNSTITMTRHHAAITGTRAPTSDDPLLLFQPPGRYDILVMSILYAEEFGVLLLGSVAGYEAVALFPREQGACGNDGMDESRDMGQNQIIYDFGIA